MSLFNHIIGFRSKNSNKITIATLYYISGMVLSSGFEDKWFVFFIFIILLPVVVFEIKDIFVKKNHKSVIKVLVCSIIIAFSVYIFPAQEKITNEPFIQKEDLISERTETNDEEIIAEPIPVFETEMKDPEIQKEEKTEKIVYKGKTGNKFHKSDCGTLKGKGTPITYEVAINEGREACKICKP